MNLQQQLGRYQLPLSAGVLATVLVAGIWVSIICLGARVGER